ncbi:MAG TPA: hypothetical protein VGM12_04480 [Trebonia sp.]
MLTRRICIGLQRKDAGLLAHGVETGIIRQLPDGGFVEEHRPLTDEERAPLLTKQVPAIMPAPDGDGAGDGNGVPAPQTRGPAGRARAIANRAFAETVPFQPDGHHRANGHDHGRGNGHANGHDHHANGHDRDGQNPAPETDPASLRSPTAGN